MSTIISKKIAAKSQAAILLVFRCGRGDYSTLDYQGLTGNQPLSPSTLKA